MGQPAARPVLAAAALRANQAKAHGSDPALGPAGAALLLGRAAVCAVLCQSRHRAPGALRARPRGDAHPQPGLGTFVAVHKLEERFGPGMDFMRQWAAAGTPIQPTLLAFERCGADEQVASALELEVGTQVLFIKRTRAAARVPVAIDYRYLPADLVTDWDESAALASPLHLLWQRVELRSGDFGIEAGIAGPEEVEYLHLAAGDPVLTRTLRYRDVSGRLVMAGHTVHRGDLVRYSLNVPLSRDGAAQPSEIDKSGVHDD